MERFIGHVVNRFHVVWKKYNGDWEELGTIVRCCLALHNIENHIDLVRRKIFEKTEDEWTTMIEQHNSWLEEEIIPILSQREMERRHQQIEAQSQPDSVSLYLINVIL